MASIQKRGKTFKITVTTGARNANGNAKRKSITYTPDPQKSEAEQLKEVLEAAEQFEDSVRTSIIDVNIKFAEYARTCIDEKHSAGALTEKTYARYLDMLRRINLEIGNVKMTDITVRHLRNLYSSMRSSVNGYNESCYIATDAFREAVKGMAVNHLASASGVNTKTIVRAKEGGRIWRTSAEKLAKALDMELDKAFCVDRQKKKRLSERTIRHHHELISGIMQYAVDEELIKKNPASKAWVTNTDNTAGCEKDEVEPLTVDEYIEILEASQKESLKWQCFIRLLIEIGERRGAIVGIKLENIDVAGNRIRIRHTVVSVNGKTHQKSTTKNKRSMRWVEVSPNAMNLVEALMRERESLKMANGPRWQESGYLFVQENGLPMHPDTPTHFLTQFSERHGLRHLYPHLFRHSLASLLAENGFSIAAIAKVIGDRPDTISNYYTHPYDNANAASIETLNTLFKTE